MNVAKKMVHGAAWMMAIRWCIRGLDIVLLIVLARVLTTEDFGVFAAAALVVGFLEILSQAGIDTALIRDSGASEETFNSAWTVQIVQGSIVAVLLFSSAPILAELFNEERLTAVIQLLALRPLIQAFTNIGTVNFLRDMEYRSDFLFGLYRRLALFVSTLVLALMLRSYMAMVWGTLIGSAIGVAISYALHPHRPRLTFSRVREVWAFSGFMLIYYAADDLADKLDRFVIARLANSSVLGQFHVASQIVYLPLEALITPLWKALIPGYAKLTSDPERLADTFKGVFGLTALVCFGAGFTTLAVVEDAILGLLGEQWTDAVSFARVLALIPALAGFVDSSMMVVTVSGHARLCALNSVIRLITLVAVLPAAGLLFGAQAVAQAYLLCAILLAPVAWLILRQVLFVSTGTLVGQLWRPFVAGVCVPFAVAAFGAQDMHPLLALPINVGLSIVVYLVVLAGLWMLARRPRGAETSAVNFLLRRAA